MFYYRKLRMCKKAKPKPHTLKSEKRVEKKWKEDKKGFFQLPKQSSAPAQNNGAQSTATTATQLMGSRITSWRVDLASPQPEPEDLLRWSGACQFSLSLESHSRFIHDDVNWKGIKLHILLTTGARSASRHPARLAAQPSLLSRWGQAPGNENSPTEKGGHSWALCWRML